MIMKRIVLWLLCLIMAISMIPMAMADEVPTLRVWTFGVNSTSEECEAVSKAMSEITRDKLGINVSIVKSGDGEKLNLALTSGEQLDLVNFHTYAGGLTALVSNELALPIDELAAEYGKDALEIVGEEWLAYGKVNGMLYSLPNMHDFATGYGMAMRKDILDEMNIDPETIKTWDDIHDVLVKVKKAYPDMYPVVSSWGGGGMQRAFAFDSLGTGFWDAMGVLEDCHSDSTEVVNLFETQSYYNFCKMMYQWNQEGLLMPDVTTSTESGLMKTVGFASFENYNPTKAADMSNSNKHEITIIITAQPYMGSNAGGSSFFIPSESKYPVEAMKLWNLLYTDPTLSTLFFYGIEGKDYDFIDEARTTVKRREESTFDWQDWAIPNAWITPVKEGENVEKWAILKDFCKKAAVCPAAGFAFNSENVLNEITACSNVISKYDVALRWGTLNPDEALPKFIAELKAAGINTIIAEKQAQLDIFLGK